MTRPKVQPRFMKLEDLARLLDVSHAQAYALVRSGEVPAIKVGGPGCPAPVRAIG